MAGTATAATGASAQSQQPAPESPEVVAARAKANDAGFARNRAEAAYNAAKKEKGADSPEAKAAKTALEAAQAEVEKTQTELKAALKLPTKNSAPVAKKTKAAPSRTPAPKATVAKNEAPVSKTPAPESEPPKAFFLERVILEHRSFESIKDIDPKLKERIEKIIREQKFTPKNLEYFQKQLNHGEMLRTFEAPVRGEMAIRRDAAYLMKVSAPKLEKR
jgi:hypothetical protein